MAVVARHGAQELNLFAAPRLFPADASGIRLRNGVEHNIQARIAAGNHIFRPHAENIGEQSPHGRQTGGQAVIAAVEAVLQQAAFLLPGLGQESAREVELVGGRLPAGHIQLQAGGLITFVFFFALFNRLHDFRLSAH